MDSAWHLTRVINGRCFNTPGGDIEVVKLEDYVVGSSACNMIFKSMKNLKVLSFNYAAKQDIGEIWNVEPLFSDLMATMGERLEVLDLTSNYLAIARDPLVLPLHEFERLRGLTLSARMFYAWDICEVGLSQALPDVPKLVDTLPRLLTKFKPEVYTIDWDVTCPPQLFKDFSTERASTLPNL